MFILYIEHENLIGCCIVKGSDVVLRGLGNKGQLLNCLLLKDISAEHQKLDGVTKRKC